MLRICSLFLALICACAISYPAAAGTVNIPDLALDAALRSALGNPTGPLDDADLATITTLNAANLGVIDLTGLEFCTSLTSLNLNINQILDISPLSGLGSLQELHLSSNFISDLSPLAGLVNLNNLSLGFNQASDLAPLAGLTTLQRLAIEGNGISDISPLAGLVNISSLGLYSNQITDISALSGMSGLSFLLIFSNQISDASPLANLDSLTDLHIGQNSITDLSPFSGLSALEELYLDSNGIVDVSPLAGITSLIKLGLDNNNIANLSPLSGLTQLTELYLSGNDIASVEYLSSLVSLSILDLGSNEIFNAQPLTGLGLLATLDLSDNALCVLPQFTNLNLDVSANPLSIDSCLNQIPQMEGLGVVVNSGTVCDAGGQASCVDVNIYVAAGGNGDGSLANPFGNIQTAIDFAGTLFTAEQRVVVQVAPGDYVETLVFLPNTHLHGSGQGITRIVPSLGLLEGPGGMVVRGANDSSMQALSVVLPVNAPATTLVGIPHASMLMREVTLDGNGSAGSLGLAILGTDSSGSLVKDCSIVNVESGLEAVDSGARLAFNTFNGISGAAAIQVSGETGTAPALGNLGDLVNSGSNVFTNIAGKFITIDGPAVVNAQANYWDNLPVESAIIAAIDGNVNVSPHLFTLDYAKLPAASLFVTVLDNSTTNPVSGAQVTLVHSISTLSESPTPGVYVAPLLSLGVYTVRARAEGYQEQVQLISAASGINSQTIELDGETPAPDDPLPLIHKGDRNGNTRLDLNEVLRIIQLYNSGNGYSCGGGEDGYQLGPAGGFLCQPHGADYEGGAPDWRIRLSETLRIIQFYSTGGYYRCLGATEDGYCPRDW